MEPITERLRKALPRDIHPGMVREQTECISHADPAAFWEHLLGAILNGRSSALLSHGWPRTWKDQLATTARSLPESEEPAILIPTSGTSCLPKFCIHDLDTLSCAAIGFAQAFGARGIIHSISLLPQHHVGGLMPVFRAAECGGRVHFADYREAKTIASAPFPLKEACLSVVPTQLIRMRENSQLVGLLRRLGLILTGSAACPPNLLDWARRERLNLAPCYGSTETAAMVTAMDPEDFIAGATGVGTPLPHVKLLVDEEQRVRIRAGSNLRAYWPSRERFTRDPFVTGDLGLIDTAGNLQILGRADRIIITGGEKVHPEQVETAAMGTGLATGARCEGQPDPDWGQRVELTVVPSSPDTTRDGLVDALRETLPAYALPKKVLFVEQIFTNSMGKPVK